MTNDAPQIILRLLEFFVVHFVCNYFFSSSVSWILLYIRQCINVKSTMNATVVCVVLFVIGHPPNLHEWRRGLCRILVDNWRPPTKLCRLTFDRVSINFTTQIIPPPQMGPNQYIPQCMQTIYNHDKYKIVCYVFCIIFYIQNSTIGSYFQLQELC